MSFFFHTCVLKRYSFASPSVPSGRDKRIGAPDLSVGFATMPGKQPTDGNQEGELEVVPGPVGSRCAGHTVEFDSPAFRSDSSGSNGFHIKEPMGSRRVNMEKDVQSEQKRLLEIVSDTTLEFDVRDAAWNAIRRQYGRPKRPVVPMGKIGLGARLLTELADIQNSFDGKGSDLNTLHRRVCRMLGMPRAGKKRIRTDWSLHLLSKVGLVTQSDDGKWKATDEGLRLVRENMDEFGSLKGSIKELVRMKQDEG